MTAVVAGLTAVQLAAYIVAAYLAVVALGDRAGAGRLATSILAAAVVALTFEPTRRGATYVANRVAYGTRTAPLEAVAALSEEMVRSPGDELVERMAEIVCRASGAASTAVWLHESGGWRVVAGHPATAEPPTAPDAADATVPVTATGGEVLGAFSIEVRRGRRLHGRDEAVLRDLAALAATALGNVLLRAELRRHVDALEAHATALRASRRRIVAAEDEERRRLERDIHDGGQQVLTAVGMRLSQAMLLLARRPAEVAAVLEEVAELVPTATAAIDALAAGVYPAALEDGGLVAALRDATTVLPLAVQLDARGGDAELDPAVAAAAYFVCIEAVQNAMKHGRARRVRIDVAMEGGELRFEVEDDGVGFTVSDVAAGAGLASMRDRIDARRGRFEVASAPGAGTTVRGTLPLILSMVGS